MGLRVPNYRSLFDHGNAWSLNTSQSIRLCDRVIVGGATGITDFALRCSVDHQTTDVESHRKRR